MKKYSMQDIADELGLSTTTVSFVVNGKASQMGINTSTENKVNALIKKKGYKPNNAARVLRTGKSNTIALIVEDIGNHFFGNIAKIIESEANKKNIKVFFSSTENDTEIAKGLISAMRQSSVDGLIITATIGLEDEIRFLKKEKIPCVLIDRLLPNIQNDYVIVDNFGGAKQLTQHLLNQGYRNISLVTIAKGMSQMEDRKNGYLFAIQKNNHPICKHHILELPFKDTHESLIKILIDYLNLYKEIDALFFTTNYLGLLGIEVCQIMQKKIGKDIAIVSFDDNDAFRLISPSITVAAQPIKEIATKAFDILFNKINNKKINTLLNKEILSPTIIIRNSSPKRME